MKTTLTNNLPIQIKGLSKTEINALSTRIVDSVAQGVENAGELYVKLDFLKKTIDKSIKEIKSEAVEELSKYDKGQSLMGVEITIANKASYSYKHNPEWVAKKAELTAIENEMKMAAKSINSILNEDTGEIIPPAIATYSDSVTPKYPK